MIQIWLKTWKSQMIDRLARMTKIGFSRGSVTSRKTFHDRAPSIWAASISSLRHLRQAREDGDRDERNRTPDDQRRDDGEAAPRIHEPVMVEEIARVELW